jgi:hypothetical protein
MRERGSRLGVHLGRNTHAASRRAALPARACRAARWTHAHPSRACRRLVARAPGAKVAARSAKAPVTRAQAAPVAAAAAVTQRAPDFTTKLFTKEAVSIAGEMECAPRAARASNPKRAHVARARCVAGELVSMRAPLAPEPASSLRA